MTSAFSCSVASVFSRCFINHPSIFMTGLFPFQDHGITGADPSHCVAKANNPLEGLPIHHRPTARLPTTHFYTERQLQQPINQTSMKLIRDWSINTQKMLHDAIETFPLKKKRNAYFHLCITYCLIDLISNINSFQALIIIECINKNVISVYAESK